MQEKLTQIIAEVLKKAGAEKPNVQVTLPKESGHGDLSTSAAMANAKAIRKPPREIAQVIVDGVKEAMPDNFSEMKIEGPGFVNFFLKAENAAEIIREVIENAENFGRNVAADPDQKVLLEFVSANPTGPLNVVNARAAAVGDSMARILNFSGIRCDTEFYVNDAGNQVQILGKSVYLRYLESFGEKPEWPEDAYQGDYVQSIAEEIKKEVGDRYLKADKSEAVSFFSNEAIRLMIEDQRQTLNVYGTRFTNWFSEKTLHDRSRVQNALEHFKDKDMAYENDGAWWFRSENFGDEKDRVLLRSNGEPTYFLADTAYHEDKYQRGYTRLVDIWGPDHHGYIPRLSAGLKALGYPEDSFHVLIAQQVNLIENGEKVRLSKRKGKMVLMRDLVEDVGADACRYFFTMRTLDSHLDFDLDLAKKMSSENPVYYVQYAHARCNNVFTKAREKGMLEQEFSEKLLAELSKKANLEKLTEADLELAGVLRAFPVILKGAAENLQPHRLVNYLHDDLAGSLQRYYQQPENMILCDDRELRTARLCLAGAVKQVLKTGLELLGINAPDRM